MYKNILTYELILLALLMLPSTIIATNASKNPPAEEKIPIELQRERFQQHMAQRMKRIKFAAEFSDDSMKAQLIHNGIRGGA